MPCNRGYKYALDLNQDKEAIIYLNKAFGCIRKFKNIYINSLYEKLEKEGYTGGRIKMKLKEASAIKKDYGYMKEIDSLAYSNAKQHIETAISKFNKEHLGKGYTKRALKRQKTLGIAPTMRDLKGMPSFYKKKDKQSFTTNNQLNKSGNYTVKLKGNALYIPKYKKPIYLIMHRPLPEGWLIKSVTFSKETNGKYFASILIEAPDELLVDRKPQNVVGLDYAQQDFFVNDLGEKANYPKYYKKAERRLKRMQRSLSRKQKDSKNFEKQKAKVNHMHTHVANQRRDFLHKLSRDMANTYDYVVVEDINLNGMAGALKLGKNLHDNGFGMFRAFISYKLEAKGGMLIKIDKFYPSSKTCSGCGGYHEHLTLKDRTFVCPHCGLVIQRDKNAAINIKAEGLRILKDKLADRCKN